MVLKKLIKERSLFVCNFNTPNKRMIFFFGFFVSQKSAESKSVGARRERNARRERKREREREREREKERA